MCQWCGNPWGIGGYSVSIKKMLSKKQILRIITKNPTESKKLCKFNKRMLNRHKKNPSSLLIKCQVCLKNNSIKIPLPPKPTVPSSKATISSNSALKKKNKNKQQKTAKKNAQSAKKIVTSIKQPNKKQLSNTKLKKIAKGLKKPSSTLPMSSLQKFLNTVK